MNKVLYAVRKTTKFKPDNLAEELDITVDEYLKLEAGERQVDTAMAERLGKIFDLEPELFFNDMPQLVNHNTGAQSHGNIINSPENYTDCHYGVPIEKYEKVLKERDALEYSSKKK
ncbi:MAG TPA: helix-turn-helix transcriptional regulator [Chitinophagaceae bacterium]|nr:helix-turn-helix transcriptional regulator [Chitinophagaceae bacterium]